MRKLKIYCVVIYISWRLLNDYSQGSLSSAEWPAAPAHPPDSDTTLPGFEERNSTTEPVLLTVVVNFYHKWQDMLYYFIWVQFYAIFQKVYLYVKKD